MKGIIIASHGPMAEGILETSKLFMGEQDQLLAKCLQPTDNPDTFIEDLKKAISEVDTGDGVLVLCDLLFGSPCNCMARIIGNNLEDDKIEVVTGVNLAMVLQALATRESDAMELSEIIDSGTQGIANLKDALKN